MNYILLLFIILHPLYSTTSEWADYKKKISTESARIQGWCSQEKAEILMDFVYQHKPALCVEIGTFAGSTTYPLIQTLSYLQEGKLYTIDAWNNRAAVEGLEESHPSIPFWSSVDMDEPYKSFISLLERQKLTHICFPIRKKSEDAISLFEDHSIDLLYIDGNISATGSLQDVLLYLPKVKKGGYLWLNDGQYRSKLKTVTFLMKNCTWLKQRSTATCLLFKNEPESNPA